MAFTATGNPAASSLYTPYGATRYTNGTMPTDHGFTGQENDATTGLDYYGAWYYDPAVGQFTSADSVVDGLNRYSYVQDNPTTYNDPTGHLASCPSGLQDLANESLAVALLGPLSYLIDGVGGGLIAYGNANVGLQAAATLTKRTSGSYEFLSNAGVRATGESFSFWPMAKSIVRGFLPGGEGTNDYVINTLRSIFNDNNIAKAIRDGSRDSSALDGFLERFPGLAKATKALGYAGDALLVVGSILNGVIAGIQFSQSGMDYGDPNQGLKTVAVGGLRHLVPE